MKKLIPDLPEDIALACELPEGILPYLENFTVKSPKKSLFDKIRDLEAELELLLRQIPQEYGLPDLRDFSINFEINFVYKSGKSAMNLRENLEKALSAFLEKKPTQGRVYCYFCRSFACPHSKPEKITEVFIGYDARGVCQYIDFHQFLLEKGVQRVDELFSENPSLLSYFQYGKELTKELLPSFSYGKKEYQILAQISVGYLGNRENRIALTVQVVKAALSLYVNILNYEQLLELENKKPLSFEKTVLGILQSFRRKISGWNKLPKDLEKKFLAELPKVLQGLQKDIEAINRRDGRRTKHAQLRHLQKRPIAQAVQDLKKAKVEDFFWDERKNSFVVKGPKNRFHIFSPSGQHVTSLFLEKNSFEQRLRKGRWKPYLGNVQELKQKILQQGLSK